MKGDHFKLPFNDYEKVLFFDYFFCSSFPFFFFIDLASD